jgi:glycosyltransferase involved in cell wall biosynthesis
VTGPTTTPPIRVLLVGRGLPEAGGIAVFLEGLRTGLLADEFEISFLNLTRPHDMGPGGFFTFSNLRRSLDDLRSVFTRSKDVDLVHLHSALAPTPTMLRAGALAAAARLRRRKVVVHAHGGRVISWMDTRGASAVTRVSMSPVTFVVAVSEQAADVLGGVLGPDRVGHIPNGVDTIALRVPTSRRTDVATPRILYVGHLSRRKGVLDLDEASRRLRAKGIQHELVLVGGRPDEGSEEYDLVAAALGRDVVALGPVDHGDIEAVYHSATVFCLPSWWEAMPLSILEAMATGLPVVATAVGDVPRLVVDGETGFLVEPRRPDLLEAALECVLSDPGMGEQMGTKGRDRVERTFDITATHRSVADLYLTLLDTPSDRSKARPR